MFINKRYTYLVLLVFINIHGLSVGAKTPIPTFVPNVVDSAKVLNTVEIEKINNAITKLQESAKIDAAVFIVKKLNDESIEELAESGFKIWKLGQAGIDNGLLLVLALDERKMRIQVGYGLRIEMSDLVARRLLENALSPYLRESRVADGIANLFNNFLILKSQAQASVNRLNSEAVKESKKPIHFVNGFMAFLF